MVGGDLLDVDCDWGLNGLRALARGRVVVIVDVLSFSTATTVAVARGAEILPCDWNDEHAAALAYAERAEVASKRGRGKFSLAPSSLKKIEKGTRLVLPSPNGSALAFAARELDAQAVLVGCLRNAGAAAKWLNAQRKPVAVIAAGERWDDGTIRFAIEDWLGAGAIIGRIHASMSPLAVSASRTFDVFEKRLDEILAVSASGQELIRAGYADDIEIASELDVDSGVPLLRGNAFTLATL
jgi:2-phosphosulfolactate phosphatase